VSETWRLFIALELPPDVLTAIGRLQADLKKVIGPRSARWTRPEGLHLTLKFLGDVPVDQVAVLEAALRQVGPGHQPFELHARSLGCFPNLERPRVLWVGLAGDLAKLRALQADVEQRIEKLGFPADERGFNPHLTLARTAQAASRAEAASIGAAARQHDPGELVSWRVTSVSLMRSQLKPDGAVYTQVQVIMLGPGG
jgi:RNA 2',3'-cyclic 3'-phosphodiesterase